MVIKSPLVKFLLFLLIPILFLYGIIVAKDFLYPLAFAALFAYLLYPVVNFLEKNSFPRVLAILTALLLAIVVVFGVFSLFYTQVSNMLDDFDTLKNTANNNIEQLQYNLQNYLGLKNNRIEDFLKDHINDFFETGGGGIGIIFSATTGTVIRIVILPIYIFLFLYYRTKFAYFILKITREENKKTAIKILRDISSVAARYMGGVTLVVFILCVLNSVGLIIIGIKYAIILGIISAFFNYIPYFGTLIGGSVPFLFVLLTTQTPIENAIQVGILFIIIQFTENNILTPNIVGGNVKINPFFIIIGLVFGSTVWGIPGMLVIIPFLAILRIILNSIPTLQPYAFLLGPGGTRKHAWSLKKIRAKLRFSKKRESSNN
ncbi:MAG: AI-2E family transporter [Bacteroidetes bacterium]|nr:AI-2E family transporter [Bacteroidota bacterium]